MTPESLPCNRCGAMLHVGPGINFVTCNHCGTHLAVKRTADSTYTEAATSAPALDKVADQLEEITHQNELARIDREWQIEREQYMMVSRYGQRYLPTRTMSFVGGLVIVPFGVLWTVFAFFLTSGIPTGAGPLQIVHIIFPLFGVIFIVAGIAMTVYSYKKAQQYEQAYMRYRQRRAAILDRDQGHGPKAWEG